MHVLFVHQNCPAQFRHIAPALVERGHTCTFVTNNPQAPAGAGVRKIFYRPVVWKIPRGGDPITHPFQAEAGHARGIYEAIKRATKAGLPKPDLIVAHSGFGSSLFLPLLYDAPIINFFEYFFGAGGAGQHLGYRPEVPVPEAGLMGRMLRNACFLLDLNNCDRGWCPNRCQRDTLPAEYHPKLEILPEGIDTDLWRPGGRGRKRRLQLDGAAISPGTRLVTYSARGLERMRGFDIFMKVAKRVYEQVPDVLFVVVGSQKTYYSDDPRKAGGKSFRDQVLAQDDYDLSKFRFTGRVPPEHLAAILGMSDLHVYLTEPFVTSWSLLNAMACGCVVLGSDQACVREYIKDGENGLLCDFFDVERMTERSVAALSDPAGHRRLGRAARRTILEEGYALRDTLPRLESFFRDVAAKPRSPSMRAELFVRASVSPGAPDVNGAPAWEGEPPGEPRLAAEDALPAVVDRGSAGASPSRAGASPSRSAAARSRKAAPLGLAAQILASPVMPVVAAAFAATLAIPMPVPAVSFHLPGNSSSKRILFCWELGAGLGHIMEIAPLVNAMCERGHVVRAAMRHVTEAGKAFDARARLLAAPYLGEARPTRRGARSFADILTGLTFSDDDTLLAHCDAWCGLFELTRPDVIVFDYSPTALLAARIAAPQAKRIVIGNGFLIPPDISPLPPLRTEAELGQPGAMNSLGAEEQALLDRANRIVAGCGRAGCGLDRLGQLFGDVDLTLMMTMREMDPYARFRPAGTEYLGAVNATGGKAPQWPKGEGLRVYAYLRPFPAMGDLLKYLGERRLPSVVFAPSLNEAGRRQFAQYKTLRLETERLDLNRCGAECDVAVLNGNLGTSSAMLLAGKPALHLPEHLEHALNARAVAALGAGLVAPVKEPGVAVGKLAALLGQGSHAAGAAAVAARYRGFTPGRQAARMVEAMELSLARAA